MDLAFEYRLYPTNDQKVLFTKTFGCSRFVFNKTLDLRQKLYNQGVKRSIFDFIKMLPEWKQEYKWLTEVDSIALQQSLRDLDKAYIGNWKHNRGFPKFKSKKNRKQSYRTNNVQIGENFIKLPKIGKVKARISRPIQGKILSATIKRTATNKYFISICCTDVPEKESALNNAIGLDVGIKSLIITSAGKIFDNPKNTKKYEKKLAKEQRRLSRKKKRSKNYQKQRVKVAKVHEKITNSRKDTIHKATSAITKENKLVCTEDLAVKNMMKNHKLAKALADSSFSEIIRQLEYKTKWRGGTLQKVDRFFPSSKLCSNCGYKSPQMPLEIRQWTCPQCGSHHDRDINAAKNILAEGLRLGSAGHAQTAPRSS